MKTQNRHSSASSSMNLVMMLFTALILLGSCGMNRQARSMKALEQCKYELVGVDSLLLAGTDVLNMLRDGNVDITRLPGVALSFLSGELPMKAKLQLQISNPTQYTAGIQAFQYQILMDGVEAIEGSSGLPISVPAGATEIVPIHIQANVYHLVNSRENLRKILSLFDENAKANAQNHPGIKLTLRLKPTISLGNQAIDYPGFITVHKVLRPGMIPLR